MVLRQTRGSRAAVALVVAGWTVLAGSCAFPARVPAAALPKLRIATYNASLNRDAAGQLLMDLADGRNRQAQKVAEVLQRVRPDVVLINEFDFDETGEAARRFHDHYLAVSQNGHAPLQYPYRFAPPVNTGVPANTATSATFDFDNDGRATFDMPPASDRTAGTAYGNDCFGFGTFPGQYGFVVYSRFPIRADQVRTFQLLKWRDMPDAAVPPGWYSPEELTVFRLSSKSHADVPIEVAPGAVFHLLASHPTPPAFDGNEDRNGRRNHDEIRLWADYLKGAAYLRDDRGTSGGLADGVRFVVAGDLNADPLDGDSYRGAILQLLQHPRVNADFIPAGPGGSEQATAQGGVNLSHRGNPAHDTGDFGDRPPRGPGNLRIDYVLPSRDGWRVIDGGIFWPASEDPSFGLIDASDHRLTYLDVQITPIAGALTP